MSIKRKIFKKIMSINPSTRLWSLLWKYRHLFEGDKWILSYNDLDHPHRKLLIDIISKYYPFDNVLEIGCGLGSNLYLLAQKYPNIKLYGIDINSKVIEKGKMLLEENGINNIYLQQGNALKIDFINKKFDIVFSDACFLCVSPDKIQNIINEIDRLSVKAIILNEYHSEKIDFYKKCEVYWVYNYKRFFPNLIEHKITHDLWDSKNWQEYGYIMEVAK